MATHENRFRTRIESHFEKHLQEQLDDLANYCPETPHEFTAKYNTIVNLLQLIIPPPKK